MSLVVRTARPADAEGIARVEVETWRDAYPTLLPESFLIGGLDAAHRARVWRRRLAQRGAAETIIAALDTAAGVVGYAAFGPARTPALAPAAELYELYLLPDYQGLGLGRCLCGAVAERLTEAGTPSLCVEVLEGNVARFFYEAMGGRLAARKAHAFAGRNLPTLVYAWDDLRALVGAGAA